jgi:hypothetical protein
MDQFHSTRNAENHTVSGEVIPPEEDTEDTMDTAGTTPQAGYPQTYLHKVASARPGGGSEETAPDDTVPDNTVPDNTVPDNTVPDDIADEAPGGTDSYATADGDYSAGEREHRDATLGENRDEALAGENRDQAFADENREHAAADARGAAETGPVWPSAVPASSDVAEPTSVADVPAATTAPDMIPPIAVTSADDQFGRHGADAPGAEPASGPAGSQGRRPGDEPVPPGLADNLLPDSSGIREQWLRVQAQFVDDPRAAVSEAATIITDVAARLETAVRERQQTLRARWDGNSQADTEALRVTMQQYRHLLERLAGF